MKVEDWEVGGEVGFHWPLVFDIVVGVPMEERSEDVRMRSRRRKSRKSVLFWPHL